MQFITRAGQSSETNQGTAADTAPANTMNDADLTIRYLAKQVCWWSMQEGAQ